MDKMKLWLLLTGLFIALTFSGCGLLVRNRMTNHHGIEQNDYNLPVIVYPTANIFSKRILFLFSGDGGWLEFEDRLATEYTKKGFYVIGFNSRSYFWSQKTPQETADDVFLLIDKYNALYKTNRIFLCGFSFGADVVPFIYNGLPERIRDKIVAVQLLSPFSSSDFKVHTSDLLNIAGDNRLYKVAPEVEKIDVPVYCFYGKAEEVKPLSELKMSNFKLTIVPGAHRYDESAYAKIVASLRPKRFLGRQLSLISLGKI
ncbi:hypothetical protein DBR11_07265 [Pedobacter sp. HMWF019]|nr:hypothetical protein DBR11_07265 [Pedobacter sp. HMWF019]